MAVPKIQPRRSAGAKRWPRQLLNMTGWQLAGRLRLAWHGPTQKLARVPNQVDIERILTAPGTGPAEWAEALAFAIGEGALESAGRIATLLAPSLPELSGASAGRAYEDVVETLIIHGERTQARTLAQTHAAVLAATVNGVSLLNLLELGSGSVWLPNGRPNLLALSRQLASGNLAARDVTSIITRKPWLLLSAPEVHLLMFSAYWPNESRRALRFLNRYLELQGLPRLRLRKGKAETANVLAGLGPDRPASHAGGPLVSIVVPARNAEWTVGYAVRSLLEQTYQNTEILVGDDASEDGTLDVLRGLAASDPRIRLFRSARAQCAYNIRNALAQAARGPLLAFHDADDFALPTRIACQVKVMQQNASSACAGSWLRVKPNGRVIFFKNQKASRLSLVSLMLGRRLFLEQGGFRSARVGADLELYSRLRSRLGADAVTRIRAPLILGLWSEQSVTRQSGTEALEDGYRSEMRRRYSELVALQRRPGAKPSDPDCDASLRASGNYLEPCALTELGRP